MLRDVSEGGEPEELIEPLKGLHNAADTLWLSNHAIFIYLFI